MISYPKLNKDKHVQAFGVSIVLLFTIFLLISWGMFRQCDIFAFHFITIISNGDLCIYYLYLKWQI